MSSHCSLLYLGYERELPYSHNILSPRNKLSPLYAPACLLALQEIDFKMLEQIVSGAMCCGCTVDGCHMS